MKANIKRIFNYGLYKNINTIGKRAFKSAYIVLNSPKNTAEALTSAKEIGKIPLNTKMLADNGKFYRLSQKDKDMTNTVKRFIEKGYITDNDFITV